MLAQVPIRLHLAVSRRARPTVKLHGYSSSSSSSYCARAASAADGAATGCSPFALMYCCAAFRASTKLAVARKS